MLTLNGILAGFFLLISVVALYCFVGKIIDIFEKIDDIHKKMFPEKYKKEDTGEESEEDETFYIDDWVQDSKEDEAKRLIEEWLEKAKQENIEIEDGAMYKIGPARFGDENMVGIYYVTPENTSQVIE